MITRSPFVRSFAAFISLTNLGVANAQSFYDGFEADTFDPFWTISEAFGSHYFDDFSFEQED